MEAVVMDVVGGRPSRAFWAGKRVLLTGHTGFKGAWAARMLAQLGADVTGFSLPAEGWPTAYGLLGVQAGLGREVLADLADRAALGAALHGADIVLHLAAQAIVSQGYAQPADTWASNVTGTLNLLDGLRGSDVQAAVLVTSDKVYRNDSAARPFVESDALGGDDPYSASKAACEILVASHRASFADLPPIATARAGNVIGGGDFGRDRLIPDLVRANAAGAALVLRNPDATRPFQHVLDVLSGYLMLAELLCDAAAVQVGAVNFGPAEAELSVRDVLGHWGAAVGAPVNWQLSSAPPMLEKSRLALDSGLAKSALGWAARKDTRAAIADTARWYHAWAQGADMAARSDAAITEYLEE